VSETDEPNTVIDFLDAEAVTGERCRDVDFLAVPADATVSTDVKGNASELRPRNPPEAPSFPMCIHDRMCFGAGTFNGLVVHGARQRDRPAPGN